MSMLDVAKVYEKTALEFAKELHMYIGQNMVKADVVRRKGKLRAVGRNPNKGAGTLRMISGKLYRSFAPKKVSDGNIFEFSVKGEGFSFSYGSKVAYARIHEYGGVAGNGANIPRRPYFKPAIRDWKKNSLDDEKRKIKMQFIKEMEVWLANQKQLKR
jgi:hypothetical protein